MNYRLEHIGITVANLESAIESYKALGFQEIKRADKPDLKLELATMQLGDFRLELIKPYESPLETELHKVGTKHIAFSVNDLTKAYDELKNNATFIKEFLERGKYFCRFPDGVLIEIIQRKSKKL